MECRVVHAHLRPGCRVLAVSDIHGAPHLLRRVLDKLDYRPGQDALVLVGDVTEKGPDSLGALRLAMELAKKPNVWVLRGNCDGLFFGTEEPQLVPLLESRDDLLFWELCRALEIGREAALTDVAGAVARFRREYPAELAFLEGLPHILETEEYLFAHAGLSAWAEPEQQQEDFVLGAPAFYKTAPAFLKLLTVGHWPVCNYSETVCDLTPRYDPARRLLAIDGGNGVKEGGQVNGVVLQDGVYKRYVCVDGLGRAQVLRPQKESETSVFFAWPDYAVDVLEEDKAGVLCAHAATGRTFRVPLQLLVRGGDGARLTGDYTDYRPALRTGDRVSVIRRCGGEVLVKKDSRQGWVPAEQLLFL